MGFRMERIYHFIPYRCFRMKLFAYTRWALYMVLAGVGFITAPVMYPIAYLLHKLTGSKILWFYHDSEDNDGCSDAVEWFNKGKCNFWVKYKWSAIRNPAWNLHAKLKPKKGVKKRVSSKGWLSKNGNEDISIFNFAVLKYVDKDGNYQDNKGEFLSMKHSIIGRMFVWYKIGKTLYWRFSSAGKKWGFWYEIQAGTSDVRYLLRFKVKRTKVWT